VVQNQEGEGVTCPFCKSASRSDWGYECGTGPDANKQRSVRCREAEIATLRERINQLEEERDAMMADLLLWRETVEAKP
jgi:hypothetical protein